MQTRQPLQRLDLKDLTTATAPTLPKHLIAVAVLVTVALAGYAMLDTNSPFAAVESPAAPITDSTTSPAAVENINYEKITGTNVVLLENKKPIDKQTIAETEIPAETAEDVFEQGISVEPLNAELKWQSVRIRRGDSLSRIFKRNNYSPKTALMIVNLNAAKILKKIHPGQEIHLAADAYNKIVGLQYDIDKVTTLHVNKIDNTFFAETIKRTPKIHNRSEKITIRDSLIQSAQRGNISIQTIYKLIDIFSWRIDFYREIYGGETLTVIFEEHYIDQEKIGNGDIIATELVTSKKKLRAIRHVLEDGSITYYAPNGDGIKGEFLRSPLKFGRVTSKFSKRRFHPILKTYRPHRGVDYGAPIGTPIRTTGDGVVKLAARKGNYGKTIIIKHGEKYTTLYAHLSRYARGIKKGIRVKQGQTIGYVGNTGWSTGPHLHYEFRVNGKHRNPLTVRLPNSPPIPAADKAEFLKQAQNWVAELENIDRPLQRAQRPR